MIPEKTVQEIQDRMDIVEVIGATIPLKRTGRNFKALCPFHPEKTPSFMVYPQKQFFICYGCGAGGDMITFVMRHEGLEFPEAVRLLAERAGVPVPNVAGGRAASHNPELYQAHEVAARFYHELLVNSSQGEAGRAYLRMRGIEPRIWKEFSLGYAPSDWDALLAHAKSQVLSPEVLEKAGLAISRGDGQGRFDRFRHRVIFPIWDVRGRVIGFGGRVLQDEEGAPKYMNSPETELYVKGRVLYGLHLAAQHIREKDFCIVVEGYMDLVTPYQAGIKNIVASMGTSLTPEQVKLIRRFTRHVVIVYDADYAGEMATLRGLDLFLEAEMRVKVSALPSGTDPDSLVHKDGVGAFAQVIRESMDLFDYKLGILKRRFDPGQVEGRVRICEEMLPTIKRVPNAIHRGEYVKRLSELLGVAEPLLWAELNRVKRDASWSPSVLTHSSTQAQMTAEDLLAGLLLEDPSRVEWLKGRLDPQVLRDLDVQRMVMWLLKMHEEGTLPQHYRSLVNRLPRGSGDWEGRLARWLAWADTVLEKERIFDELLKRLESSRRRASLEELRTSIRQAEETGDEPKTAKLILEYNRLVKEYHGVPS